MKILLIEDDHDLNDVIVRQLKRQNYIVDTCYDGEEAMHFVLNAALGYDVIIADRMLPIVNGLTLVKAMREKGIHTPVIMVTAMSGINDRIEGLDSGADDYLVKPFSMDELLARIRALSRRTADIHNTETLTYAGLRLDTLRRTLSCDNRMVELTKKECALMAALMQSGDRPLSRERIILKVWGTGADIEPGNVDNYISFLRRRLKNLKCRVTIKTQYGAGYRLEVNT